jgi:hypothetical protein
MKFLNTISSPNKKLNPTAMGLITCSIKSVIENIPYEAFTGLSTKARVTITASSCWEYNRKEGGTIQAIQDIVFMGRSGMPVPVVSLHTGKEISKIKLTETAVGGYIFWACLGIVLRTEPKDLLRAYMVTVKEPGKARTVTKASACLKIVLDVVNKLCSDPLRRGIRSSQSGMGKSHHGWNLFKDLYTEIFKSKLFDVSNSERQRVSDNVDIMSETYRALYFSSTDYTTATDYLNHDVAKECASRWMDRCGIPPLLKGIVIKTCYKPRKIYFRASGPLIKIGEKTDNPEVRVVTLSRGVLMGDPLTKPVLHLVNIGVRQLSKELGNPEFLRQVFINSKAMAKATLN